MASPPGRPEPSRPPTASSLIRTSQDGRLSLTSSPASWKPTARTWSINPPVDRRGLPAGPLDADRALAGQGDLHLIAHLQAFEHTLVGHRAKDLPVVPRPVFDRKGLGIDALDLHHG